MMNNLKKILFVILLAAATPLFISCASGSSGKPVSSAEGYGKEQQNKKGAHLWEYKRKGFFNLYSVKSDIELGNYVMNLQIKEFQKKGYGVDPPKYAELKTRLETIVKKIAAASDIPDFPYEVHIFDRPDIVNAYCLPGGKIGVFTGLFDREKGLVDINDDNQIAAVLGHEVAHATLRHVTRRLTTAMGISFIGSAASIGIGEGIGWQARYVFEQVFSLGINLYIPSYSRKYEKEADKTGFYYLSKAFYVPQAAVDIWKKAASKGGKNSRKTDFFASHPSDASRAKALEGWLFEAEQISKGQLDR